jgi:3-hydroxyisobutyrate dehydrogenase-like beta-hydroxyacid dehydrogenase
MSAADNAGEVGTRVSLVGLGHMGEAMAERLLDAGFGVTVYNRTPGKADAIVERGARRADSLAGLLGESDVCVLALTDDAALEAVTADLFTDARQGAIVVDTSTVSPEASARVAQAAEESGVRFLRAPVSGNPVVVRSGNLTIMVSGPREGFDAAEHVIRAIGPTVYYVGEGEEARVLKLVLQIVIAGTAELLGEALLLGEAGGLTRAQLLEVIGNSAAGSPFVKYKSEPLLRDDYSATFTTSMMKKDVDLVLALAADSGLTLPLTERIDQLLEQVIAGGYADHDLMALFLQLRGQREGVPAPGTSTAAR